MNGKKAKNNQKKKGKIAKRASLPEVNSSQGLINPKNKENQ